MLVIPQGLGVGWSWLDPKGRSRSRVNFTRYKRQYQLCMEKSRSADQRTVEKWYMKALMKLFAGFC